MSDHENELKKALAENGNYDPVKAARLGAEAVARLRRGLLWRERLMRFLILLLSAAMLGNLVAIFFVSSTKAMIVHAVITAILFGEILVLVVIYGIHKTAVGVLKEIKLLRLDGLARSAVADPAATLESITTTSLGGDRAPWWERTLWSLAFLSMLGGFLYWAHGQLPGAFEYVTGQAEPPTVDSYLTLAPDGAGTEVMKVCYRWMGFVPRSSFPFTTSDTAATIRWADGQGRQLPATSSTANGQRHYTVQLIEPVTPGEQVRYTQVTQSPAQATEKDGLWTCRISRAFGGDHGSVPPDVQVVAGLPAPDADVKEPPAHFWQTIQLPKGAQFVSTDPQPVMWGTCIWGDVPARGFQANRSRNKPFTCTVQYRLPKVDATQ